MTTLEFMACFAFGYCVGDLGYKVVKALWLLWRTGAK